ncbi:pancreatic secretory granule membrane major glycoprotein GP2-like isoform X1 [Triplophysa rosa]|uniref:pancreatic secretory granule membrane major glycoprotein GP2-like isoform X1 n=1 Tax=Triplophysa rosa TaxID=992332 RepID=UPI002545CDF1|nr:pancreatic secretory granule membrane major glycoprotein GP2-like isoform X1 [Triplophysa rosa]
MASEETRMKSKHLSAIILLLTCIVETHNFPDPGITLQFSHIDEAHHHVIKRSAGTPAFDPCYNYTVLDNAWRATNNRFSSQPMCDVNVSWVGWYRLFLNNQSAQMPDICVPDQSCGTHVPLWLNGQHPTIEDGVVTRPVCGNWMNDCCHFKTPSIQVKACPGNYYVYEFKDPILILMNVSHLRCAGHMLTVTNTLETALVWVDIMSQR